MSEHRIWIPRSHEKTDMVSLGLTLFLNKVRTNAQGQERRNMSGEEWLKRKKNEEELKAWQI